MSLAINYRNININTNKLQFKIADGPGSGTTIPMQYIILELDICVCNPVAPRNVVVGIQIVPDATASLAPLSSDNLVSPETGTGPAVNSPNLLAAQMVHVTADSCCKHISFKIPCFWLDSGSDLWINSNVINSIGSQFQVTFAGTYQYYYQPPVVTGNVNILSKIGKEIKKKGDKKPSEKVIQMMRQFTKMNLKKKTHHNNLFSSDSDSD